MEVRVSGGVHQPVQSVQFSSVSYTAFQGNVNLFIFKLEQQHKLERLFKLERPFTLPPLPLRPVSGRRHYLHSYGYRYVKYAPLPLAPVSR